MRVEESVKEPLRGTPDDWLREALSAYDQGDHEKAREYALAAARALPQSEQAWLLLASLSEPAQAMLYLENALRANPRSQSARKAVRLVYSRLAVQEKSHAQEPKAEALSDTAPIPVPPEAQTEPEQEFQPEPQAKYQAEIPSEAHPAPPAPLPKRSPFHRNIPAKSAIESQDLTQAPERSARRLKLVKKSAPQAAPEAQAAEEVEPAADLASPTPLEAAAPAQPTPIAESPTEPEAPLPNAEPQAAEIEAPGPIAEPLAAAIETPEPMAEPQPTEPVLPTKPPPAEAPWETASPAPPPRRTIKIAQPRKSAPQTTQGAEKPRVKADRKSVSATPKKNRQKNNKQVNVDAIELVMISIAAILLPLLVFLYFYLTR